MAYPDAFGDADAGAPSRTASVGAVAGWLGAAASVALVAGLSFWVYDLATRDTAAVPVVQAMAGPARVAPEDPGGFTAAHQGFSVNSIASDVEQPPLADRVVLAPPPVRPTGDDLAAAGVERSDAVRSAVAGALSEILGEGDAAGASGPADAAGAAPDAVSDSTIRAAPGAAAPALPRPAPRPRATDVVTRAVATPQDLGMVRPAAATAIRPAVVRGGAIPPGTRLVQLGTFETEAQAEAGWAALAERFGAYLGGHPPIIEPAEYGGTQVYRLRAGGFADLAEARALCAVFLDQSADCIPVLTR